MRASSDQRLSQSRIVKLAFHLSNEVTAENRLDHVFGIDLAEHLGVELRPRQADEAAHEAVDDFRTGVLIALLEASEQFIDGQIRIEHDAASARGVNVSCIMPTPMGEKK